MPRPQEVLLPPLGFASAQQYRSFVEQGRLALRDAGVPDGVLIMRGSSVTGIRYTKTVFFDTGGRSDYDVAIVSARLFERARTLGIAIRGDRTVAIEPGSRGSLELNLHRGLDGMNLVAGREVSVMIYRTGAHLIERGPYTILP